MHLNVSEVANLDNITHNHNNAFEKYIVFIFLEILFGILLCRRMSSGLSHSLGRPTAFFFLRSATNTQARQNFSQRQLTFRDITITVSFEA